MKGYVYILKSLKRGRFYIGSTCDLKRRLKEHEKHWSDFTATYIGDFELAFSQEYEDIHTARRIEMWLKTMKDRDLLKRIINEGIIKKL